MSKLKRRCWRFPAQTLSLGFICHCEWDCHFGIHWLTQKWIHISVRVQFPCFVSWTEHKISNIADALWQRNDHFRTALSPRASFLSKANIRPNQNNSLGLDLYTRMGRNPSVFSPRLTYQTTQNSARKNPAVLFPSKVLKQTSPVSLECKYTKLQSALENTKCRNKSSQIKFNGSVSRWVIMLRCRLPES